MSAFDPIIPFSIGDRVHRRSLLDGDGFTFEPPRIIDDMKPGGYVYHHAGYWDGPLFMGWTEAKAFMLTDDIQAEWKRRKKKSEENRRPE